MVNKKLVLVLVPILISILFLVACNSLHDTAERNRALNESLPYYELNTANYEEVSYDGNKYITTNECIPKKDLKEEIGQISKRFKNVEGKDLSFGYVYSIKGVDISDSIAVSINNEYRKANIKKDKE
jgi:hypothetical protein